MKVTPKLVQLNPDAEEWKNYDRMGGGENNLKYKIAEYLSQVPIGGVEVAQLQHLGTINSIQRIIARNKGLFVERPKEYRLKSE